jgi:hypothetical protein
LGGVVFLALCDDAALSGTAAVQFPLQQGFIKRQSGGAAINDHTDCASVRFTPSGDPKKLSEGVAHFFLEESGVRSPGFRVSALLRLK